MASLTGSADADVAVFSGVTASGNDELDPLPSPTKWGMSLSSGVTLSYSSPNSSLFYSLGDGYEAN
ncbi:MAG: hypothetical protein ACI87W_000592 [Halieaceae bacterium]|jgi:hypothetical protein